MPPAISQQHQKSKNGVSRTQLEMRELRKHLQQALANDKAVLTAAANKVRNPPKWDIWLPEQRTEETTKAVQAKIQSRVDGGQYVSCKYPEFEGFVPSLEPGVGHDPKKSALMAAHMKAMKYKPVDEVAEEEDDEEDLITYLKKEEDLTTYFKKKEYSLPGQRGRQELRGAGDRVGGREGRVQCIYTRAPLTQDFRHNLQAASFQ
jgi:heat shock protein HspQ